MDVVVWLRSLGLEEYEAAFRDNKINERVLPNLTQEDLKEIGVGPVGHRRMLLEAIAALRADAGGKATSADDAIFSWNDSARRLGGSEPAACPVRVIRYRAIRRWCADQCLLLPQERPNRGQVANDEKGHNGTHAPTKFGGICGALNMHLDLIAERRGHLTRRTIESAKVHHANCQ
jgi:hypothetical protein